MHLAESDAEYTLSDPQKLQRSEDLSMAAFSLTIGNARHDGNAAPPIRLLRNLQGSWQKSHFNEHSKSTDNHRPYWNT